MAVKTIKLRAKTTIQLPHKISKGGVEYVFTPDCDVPEVFANSLLKTYPAVFEVAKGLVDAKNYIYKQSFKDESIQSIFSKLNEEHQVELFEHARELAQKEIDAIADMKKSAEVKALKDAQEKQKQDLEAKKRADADAIRSAVAGEEAKKRAAAESK